MGRSVGTSLVEESFVDVSSSAGVWEREVEFLAALVRQHAVKSIGGWKNGGTDEAEIGVEI